VAEIQMDARGAPKIREEEYAKRCKPHKKRPRGEKRPKGKRRRYRVGEKKARPRLTKGQKSKNKKRVTVGVISSLNKQADGSWEGPFGKYIARFGDAEQVFKRLRQALDRMGPGVQQVVFYSDGDPQYARLARKYFPTATIVVDFYHVSEYLWKAGETLYKEGSKELIGFVEQLKEMVCNDEVQEVLSILWSKHETIPKRVRWTRHEGSPEEDAADDYISKRVWQMPYKELREQQLEIGSGMIESAVRQVVALRLEGPGMKWGEGRDQLILHLLCVRLSGAWDILVEAIRQWAHQPHHRRRITPVGVNEGKKGCDPKKGVAEELVSARKKIVLSLGIDKTRHEVIPFRLRQPEEPHARRPACADQRNGRCFQKACRAEAGAVADRPRPACVSRDGVGGAR